MPFFETMFMEAKGQPIEYKGEALYLSDHVSVGKHFKLRVRLISTNSEWEQFIHLSVNKGGYLILNGEKGKSIRLHEAMPPEVEIVGKSKDGVLRVWNGWIQPPPDWAERHYREGRSNIRVLESPNSLCNGAAMKKELRGDTIRYYCNDGHPDENFDDIIFELTVLPTEEP